MISSNLQSLEELCEKVYPNHGKRIFLVVFSLFIFAAALGFLAIIWELLGKHLFEFFASLSWINVVPTSIDSAIPTLVVLLVVFGTIVVLVLYLFGRQLFKRNVSQTALDRLAELRNEGIDTVYAVLITSETDFQKWKDTKRDWETRLREYIKNNFPRADYLYASHLGIVPLFKMETAFNNEHLRELCFVSRQMDIIEQILNSYRR
jgi:hypothetical protein